MAEERRNISSSQKFKFSPFEGDVNPEIELDEDYIESVYKVKNKKEFAFEETAYLKVRPSVKSGIIYNILKSDNGSCAFVSSFLEDIEEVVTFAKESMKELSYQPDGQVTIQNVPGIYFTVSGKMVKANVAVGSDKVVAAVRVKYKTYCDRLAVKFTERPLPTDASKVVIITDYERDDPTLIVDDAKESDKLGKFEVDFIGAVKKDVELIIMDIATGKPIEGVKVTVTGEPNINNEQVSDIDGKVLFEDLVIGNSYDIVMSHENYINSDEDYLNNDSFVVSNEADK